MNVARHTLLSLAIGAATVGCTTDAPSDETPPMAPSETDRDGDGIDDTDDGCPDDPEDVDGVRDDDGCPDPGDNSGVIPAPRTQTGVAYVGHFHDTELRSYRIDRSPPEPGPVFDTGALTHDLVLDGDHDLLAQVSDVAGAVQLFELDRPTDPTDDIAPPLLVSTIDFDHTPVFAQFNPARKRLYVVESPPLPPEGPITHMNFHGFDVTDASNPVPLAGYPHRIPTTTSWDLDPYRDLLFVVDNSNDTLNGFDLGNDGFASIGEPIDMRADYPETNSFAFQARNLTVDPWRNRIYAARPQTIYSELIAYEYAADVPAGGALYSDFATMADVTNVADGFDLDVPYEERPNLLNAYKPAIDTATGAVFMTASAWNGSASTAMTMSFDTNLQIAAGCGDFEGFGCFHRAFNDANPGAHLVTDGALCVDSTHARVVSTSIGSPETSPGSVHVYDFQAGMTMTHSLSESGANMTTGALAIGAVCH